VIAGHGEPGASVIVEECLSSYWGTKWSDFDNKKNEDNITQRGAEQNYSLNAAHVVLPAPAQRTQLPPRVVIIDFALSRMRSVRLHEADWRHDLAERNQGLPQSEDQSRIGRTGGELKEGGYWIQTAGHRVY
jgi:hypothetical protein